MDTRTGAFAVTKQGDGPGVVRLLVSGEIDHDVSDMLAAIIVNAMEHEHVREIVIDLDQVTCLAAAGVRSLLTAQVRAARRGAVIRLANAHGPVATVLTALGCARTFAVADVSVPAGSPTPPCPPG